MIVILAVSFFVLLLLGVPMAFSVGVSALLSILIASDLPPVVIVQQMFRQLDSYTMMAVPLFILAGQLMNNGGVTRRIINFAKIFVARIPGGLSHVNVITSMVFAGISGSATADAAGEAAIVIPAMREEGYEDDWCAGITAASSAIGPIIPPSVLMIVYGAITQLSIGRLFLAGMIPGILVGVSLLVTGYIIAIRRGRKRADFVLTRTEILNSLKEGWAPLLAPIIIIVGITGGVFTPTEAGCVAALYALILGIAYKEITWKNFVTTLWTTVKSATVVLFIIACASTFGWILAHQNVPVYIVGFLSSLSTNPGVVILLTILLMIIAGLFMDGMAIILIFVPVLFPVANLVGFDPYHYATVIVVSVMIGGITPPVGLLLYITCGVSNIPIKKTQPLIWVFVLAMVVVLFLIGYIPSLVTFLPRTLMP